MRGSTNLSRFSGKTPHVYCGRESCHASMALSRWVATRANQRATATEILLVEMFYHARSVHMQMQSLCLFWNSSIFFIGTYQPRQSWPDDPQFFFSRWWSTELVTWTGRATSCRTDHLLIHVLSENRHLQNTSCKICQSVTSITVVTTVS